MWSAVMTSLLPVEVTKMSAFSTTLSSVRTSKPSIAACSAQIGSISVTTTRAPWPRSACAQPLPTSPKPADDGQLAGDHDVGGAIETVDDGVAAAIDVVEFRLGHRVIDVDGREQQRSGFLHLIEAMHAGGRLLGNAADVFGHARPALRIARDLLAQQVEDHAPLFRLVGGIELGNVARCPRTRRLCGRAAWRRRRHRRSASGRCRPAT